MVLVAKSYRALTYYLCLFSGFLFLVVTCLVVFNALGRRTGYISITWASTVSEYILLMATTLAAPWILHKKGHIFITFIYDGLTKPARRVLEKLIYLLCIVLCLGFFAFAFEGMLDAIYNDVSDIRAINIPGWVLYAMFLPGFAFMTIEFIIFLVGRDSMFHSSDQIEVGL